jgi:hypothetical protein
MIGDVGRLQPTSFCHQLQLVDQGPAGFSSRLQPACFRCRFAGIKPG